jgi:hypothetical protein
MGDGGSGPEVLRFYSQQGRAFRIAQEGGSGEQEFCRMAALCRDAALWQGEGRWLLDV